MTTYSLTCSAPATTAPNPTVIYSAANHVTNNLYSYDNAGNVTYDGNNNYAYDGEGRLCAMQTSYVGGAMAYGYLYDAEGRRVAKGAIPVVLNMQNGTLPCNSAAITVTQSYVLGQSGEQLSTLDGSSNWLRTNISGNMATYDVNGLHFQLTDPLGTRRVQVSANGLAELNCQSLPFGDQQQCFTADNAPASADDATPLHFTGKERGVESGCGCGWSRVLI